MLHSTNPIPTTNEEPGPYWQRLLNKPFEIKLALECEWGGRAGFDGRRRLVLVDALKLSVLRAQAKVMVFGCAKPQHLQLVAESLKQLRTVARDDAPWLVVGISDDFKNSPAEAVLVERFTRTHSGKR